MLSLFHPIFAFGVDPASLALYALIASMAATGVSAASAIQQGHAQKEQANFQAEQADANARNEIARQQMQSQEGQREADQIRLARARNLGSQVNAAAKAGLTISGSVVDTMSDSAIAAETDLQMAKYRGEIAGFDSQTQGLNFTDSAKMYRVAGGNAVRAGYGQAAGTLIGGAASAVGSYASFKGAK